MVDQELAITAKKRKTFSETKLGTWIISKKNLWLKLFVPFIIIYFLLVGLPYFASTVPLIGPFVSQGNTKLLFRGMVIVLFIVYAFLVSCSLSLEVHWKWVFMFVIILITSFFTPIFSPTFVVSSYQDPQFLYYTISSVSVGGSDIVSSFVSLAFDLIFAYCFMFIFPYCVKNKNQVLWCALPLIILMVCECFYSFYFERDMYKEVLSGNYSAYGGYDLTIQATFGSKNDFGDFLLQAFLFCVISFVFLFKQKKKYFLVFPMVLFAITSVLSLCKTSAIGIALIVLSCFVFWIFVTFKTHIVRNAILSSIIGFLILCFIVFMTVPQIYNAIPIFTKVQSFFHNLIFESSLKTIGERVDLWSLGFNMMRGPSILFGYGKTISNYNLYALSGEVNRYFHNGFILIYCSYGIIGLTIYLLAIIYVFLRILKTIRFSKYIGFAFMAIFASFMVLTFSEQVTMIISGSAGIFAFNFVLVLLPFAYLISAEKKGAFYESCH